MKGYNSAKARTPLLLRLTSITKGSESTGESPFTSASAMPFGKASFAARRGIAQAGRKVSMRRWASVRIAGSVSTMRTRSCSKNVRWVRCPLARPDNPFWQTVLNLARFVLPGLIRHPALPGGVGVAGEAGLRIKSGVTI